MSPSFEFPFELAPRTRLTFRTRSLRVVRRLCNRWRWYPTDLRPHLKTRLECGTRPRSRHRETSDRFRFCIVFALYSVRENQATIGPPLLGDAGADYEGDESPAESAFISPAASAVLPASHVTGDGKTFKIIRLEKTNEPLVPIALPPTRPLDKVGISKIKPAFFFSISTRRVRR